MTRILFIAVLPFLLMACDVDLNYIKGEGEVITQKRETPEFHSIHSKGAIDVQIMPSDSYSVEIQNNENLLEYMITEVVDGVLEVKYAKGNYSNDHGRVFVRVPALDEIKSSGSGNVSIHGTLKHPKEMTVRMKGSGNLEGDVDVPLMNTYGSGSGDIRLTGRTRTHVCEIRGSGNVECEDLKSENVDVKVKGSSDVKVFASVSLNISVSGSGNVYYWGDPANPDITIKGSGKVKKMD